MAYTKMDYVMSRMTELSNANLRVLMILAKHASPTTGQCNPSYETIQKGSGCSRATVARSLNQLKEQGFITWYTVGNGTRHKHNEYFIVGETKSQTEPDQVSFSSQTKSHFERDQVSKRAKTKSHSYETIKGFDFKTSLEKGNRSRSTHHSNESKNQNQELNQEYMAKRSTIADPTIKLWNEQTWSKKYYAPLGSDYSDNSLIKHLTELCALADWDERFKTVLEEYSQSSYLRKGGKGGKLNSLSYLLANQCEFMDVVLSGKYRDKVGNTVNHEEVAGDETDERLKSAGFKEVI